MCVCSQSLSRVRLFVAPGTVACQAPLFMEFSRQEYWSGLPFPPAGNLPYPGIKRPSLASPILTGRFLTTAPPRKPAFNFLDKMALKIYVPLTSDSMLCPQRITAESFTWTEGYLTLRSNQEKWEVPTKFSKCICPACFLHQRRTNWQQNYFIFVIKNSEYKFSMKIKIENLFFSQPQKTKVI